MQNKSVWIHFTSKLQIMLKGFYLVEDCSQQCLLNFFCSSIIRDFLLTEVLRRSEIIHLHLIKASSPSTTKGSFIHPQNFKIDTGWISKPPFIWKGNFKMYDLEKCNRTLLILSLLIWILQYFKDEYTLRGRGKVVIV